MKITGAQLITIERERQLNEEGWTARHDEEEFHTNGEMAMVACCYAAPIPLRVVTVYEDHIVWEDPYKWAGWDEQWDKRKRTVMDNIKPNIDLSTKQRIRNLVKAGALIAAEIDRLQRLEEQNLLPEPGAKNK